jgi:hypothetical protein
MQVSGLTQNTTFHFRVKSRNVGGYLGTSGDYTFTTVSYQNVADLIIDNSDTGHTTTNGSWSTGTSSTDKYGTNYYYAAASSTGTSTFRWTPPILTAGNYKVYAWYPAGTNRSTGAPYTVFYKGGSSTVKMNQQSNGGKWNLLGTFFFNAGTSGYVQLSNATSSTGANVMADAVKWSYDPDLTPPSIYNISISNLTPDQATITWSTNEDSTGLVQYGLSSSYEVSTSPNLNYTKFHSITVFGLSPGTLYHYCVQSVDQFENKAVSEDYIFTTPLMKKIFNSPSNFIKSGRWNLVSLPGEPVNGDPLSIFSEIYLPSCSFQFWRNDAEGGGYVSYGTDWQGPAKRGVPYWFLYTYSTINKSVSYEGYVPVDDYELIIPAHQTAPYWVMIGLPFDQPIAAADLRFKNITKRGDSWLSWQEAYSSGNPSLRIVESNLQGWNVELNQFQGITVPEWNDDLFQLNPWWGYWFLITDPTELHILFPKPTDQ